MNLGKSLSKRLYGSENLRFSNCASKSLGLLATKLLALAWTFRDKAVVNGVEQPLLLHGLGFRGPLRMDTVWRTHLVDLADFRDFCWHRLDNKKRPAREMNPQQGVRYGVAAICN